MLSLLLAIPLALCLSGQPAASAGSSGVPASVGQTTKPAAEPTPTIAVAPVRLGIVTFNIRYGTADDKANAWSHRKDQVFEILNDDRVEVFSIQEALRTQLDEIKTACPKLAEIGVGRDDGKTKGEYSPILYRTDLWKPTKSGTFWLSEKPEEPGSKSWKAACSRVCTWARFQNAKDTKDGKARIFWVFNTHMDHVSADARLNGAKLIAKRIAERGDEMPFVVTGDFNAGEDEPATKFFLTGQAGDDRSPLDPLIDTFRIVHPYAEDVNTYHGFDPSKLTGKKIDYILAPHGMSSVAAWIDRRFKEGPPITCPSDHFPVGAIIVLPAQVPAATPNAEGGTGGSSASGERGERPSTSGR